MLAGGSGRLLRTVCHRRCTSQEASYQHWQNFLHCLFSWSGNRCGSAPLKQLSLANVAGFRSEPEVFSLCPERVEKRSVPFAAFRGGLLSRPELLSHFMHADGLPTVYHWSLRGPFPGDLLQPLGPSGCHLTHQANFRMPLSSPQGCQVQVPRLMTTA